MEVKMTAVAESKVSQLGGDVCGVLVRNEAGSYAAISECGRVMWFYDSRQSANCQRNANDELLAALSDYRGKVAELQSENKRLREENERMRDQGDAEPVAEIAEINGQAIVYWDKSLPVGTKLFARHKGADNTVQKIAETRPAVPEGWKLVPIESTSEMDIAGMSSLHDSYDGYAIDRDAAEIIWKAMVSAAPTFQGKFESEKAGGEQ